MTTSCSINPKFTLWSRDIICHTTMHRNYINYLYGPGHVTLWCLELVLVVYAIVSQFGFARRNITDELMEVWCHMIIAVNLIDQVAPHEINYHAALWTGVVICISLWDVYLVQVIKTISLFPIMLGNFQKCKLFRSVQSIHFSDETGINEKYIGSYYILTNFLSCSWHFLI